MTDPGGSRDAEEVIAVRARELLARSVQDMDPATTNRLRRLRREALAGPEPGFRGWAAPLAGSALAVALGALAWWSQPALPPGAPAASATMLPAEATPWVIASDDEAQMYAWLGDAPVAVASGQGNPL